MIKKIVIFASGILLFTLISPQISEAKVETLDVTNKQNVDLIKKGKLKFQGISIGTPLSYYSKYPSKYTLLRSIKMSMTPIPVKDKNKINCIITKDGGANIDFQEKLPYSKKKISRFVIWHYDNKLITPSMISKLYGKPLYTAKYEITKGYTTTYYSYIYSNRSFTFSKVPGDQYDLAKTYITKKYNLKEMKYWRNHLNGPTNLETMY